MNETKRGATRRKPQPVTPGMALEILQSAVGYCKSSGLTVRAGNAAGGVLVITINGAEVAGTGSEAHFAPLPAHDELPAPLPAQAFRQAFVDGATSKTQPE